ncbi:hypothetical protein [Sphingomonas xinjiangensis]|uniref:Uncharacterized protein n=1 Tax=Sphingomonas xinjiangensis TaxID=643568 RepID=A0A840YK72_9SPHN|nr:hypothetical protein [Sphingomonas xinjiangensis]MBB5709340.1 hypothetical protein [Sphingomonas xinjiangensis]
MDTDYFHRRIAAARFAAMRATTMKAFRAHMDMALAYERQLHRAA